MKRFTLLFILWVSAAVVFAFDNHPAPLPIDIPAPERQAIIDTYRVAESANKDLQIAILRARLICKADENWTLDFQAMKFTPPPVKPPVEQKAAKP